MPTIEARCTQCGSRAFGSMEDNTNSYEYSVTESKHGSGSAHGTERLPCPTCSDQCNLDGCQDEDPCKSCEEITLHNRCGKSVPRGGQ